jgi:hypothetical protein
VGDEEKKLQWRNLREFEFNSQSMEEHMNRRTIMLMATLSLVAFSSGYVLGADEHEKQQALIKSIGRAKITLQQGLTAAEAQGQPISGKFEVEDGKLQLSVYTAKDGKFSEVLVDYETGKVAKSEPITEGDDLAAAKSQSAAIAKAKSSLKAAVDKALGQSAGFRPVSVTSNMKDGRPVASVVLLKGEEFKTVQEQLE